MGICGGEFKGPTQGIVGFGILDITKTTYIIFHSQNMKYTLVIYHLPLALNPQTDYLRNISIFHFQYCIPCLFRMFLIKSYNTVSSIIPTKEDITHCIIHNPSIQWFLDYHFHLFLVSLHSPSHLVLSITSPKTYNFTYFKNINSFITLLQHLLTPYLQCKYKFKAFFQSWYMIIKNFKTRDVNASKSTHLVSRRELRRRHWLAIIWSHYSLS